MKHSQEGNWIFGYSDDVFHPSEYFDTKEGAVDRGMEDALGGGFYVGQVKSVDFAATLNVDSVIEEIALNVYEEVGEVAEDYLNHVDKPHLDVLESELNSVVQKWMDEYGYSPDFFKVINIERITE